MDFSGKQTPLLRDYYHVLLDAFCFYKFFFLSLTKFVCRRFKTSDIPASLSKGAPDFCNVYVISKGKISSMRSASRPAPAISPLRNQILNRQSVKPEPPNKYSPQPPSSKGWFCPSFTDDIHALFFYLFVFCWCLCFSLSGNKLNGRVLFLIN